MIVDASYLAFALTAEQGPCRLTPELGPGRNALDAGSKAECEKLTTLV
jgi:hypothetical protein